MHALSPKAHATSATRRPVPFRGAYGWQADMTVSPRVTAARTGFTRSELVVESYYVAELDQARATRAVRPMLKPTRTLCSSRADACHESGSD